MRFLIRDRDGKYSGPFDEGVRQRWHPDRRDAGACAEGERHRRAFRRNRPRRVSRLAADPQRPPPRARPACLRRALQRVEAASRAQAPATATAAATANTHDRRDPAPRPPRRPHPRVLPSRRVRSETNNGALHPSDATGTRRVARGPCLGRAAARLAAAAALGALAGCGGHRGAAADACDRAGFSGGSSAADGVFFAVVPRPCSGTGETVCEVGDGTGPIDREVVAAGIDQDCVAFNQFVGAGIQCDTGLRHRGVLWSRDGRRPRPAAADDPPCSTALQAWAGAVQRHRSAAAADDRPGAEAAAIRARTADPWHRAPNTGGVGDRPLFVPPWALLVWSGRDGSRCYEPGQ
jgi:hypothetical protein